MLEYNIGVVLAILYSYFILPRKEGETKTPSITLWPILYEGKILIPWTKKKIIHVHHWVIYLLLSFCINNNVFFGFAFTMIIQGLSYKDRFHFIEQCPENYHFKTVACE